MKINWKFPGMGEFKSKNHPLGEYGYFLELCNGQKHKLFIKHNAPEWLTVKLRVVTNDQNST